MTTTWITIVALIASTSAIGALVDHIRKSMVKIPAGG